MNFRYKKSILGGTFDHFHLGHQKLIDTAFADSEAVTIGLTTSKMYQHKILAENIEDYTTRETNLRKYLKDKNFLPRATIIPLENIYGTSLVDKTIEAIFATEENLKNVNLINTQRQEIGFPKLKVIVIPYVKALDDKNITSERIREGTIDRQGFAYQALFAKTLILPDSLREELHKPLGTIVKDTEEILRFVTKKQIVITVGDIITAKCKEQGLIPQLSIIDFKTRRHELERNLTISGLKAKNDQGTISRDAVAVLQEAYAVYLKTKIKQSIIIDGEEDLLALPAILFAPLRAIVLYGQFDQGIVVNEVTETLKQTILQLLKKFE